MSDKFALPHGAAMAFSQWRLRPLQAQPTVCPRLRALPGSAAEEPAGESSEEAGGAAGAAGESLSVQERSPASAAAAPPPGLLRWCPSPHPEQGEFRQEAEPLCSHRPRGVSDLRLQWPTARPSIHPYVHTYIHTRSFALFTVKYFLRFWAFLPMT